MIKSTQTHTTSCSPDISIWLSVDPLSDERSWLSPYNYCQWNPIRRVDPDGKIDYEINKNTGAITKTSDNRYFKDNDGQIHTLPKDNSLDVSKMTEVDRITNSKGDSEYFTAGSIRQSPKDLAQSESFFNSSEEANKFYGFAAKSSEVEWAYAKLKDNSLGFGGVVGTNHSSAGVALIGQWESNFGNLIELVSHSHVVSSPPSVRVTNYVNGQPVHSGDLYNASISKYNFRREVWVIPDNEFYQYDKKSYDDIHIHKRYSVHDLKKK